MENPNSLISGTVLAIRSKLNGHKAPVSGSLTMPMVPPVYMIRTDFAAILIVYYIISGFLSSSLLTCKLNKFIAFSVVVSSIILHASPVISAIFWAINGM